MEIAFPENLPEPTFLLWKSFQKDFKKMFLYFLAKKRNGCNYFGFSEF